ncbi:MAG: hypothetical protein JWM56_1428 [Candidatus Peribacteria bacterium]|nr:hypothetical protein [Candidatus Peribacteria bacterium]
MKILLTAPPATGKSTILQKVIRAYPGEKYGIIAAEMTDEAGERTAFTSINARQQSRQFMIRTDTPTADSIGGQFTVDIPAIDEFVVPELLEATTHNGALVYIDEIGRAQAKSPLFLSAVQTILTSDANILGTIVYENEPWSMPFKTMADVCLIEVTTTNRNALPDIILSAFSATELFHSLSQEKQHLALRLFKDQIKKNKLISAHKLFTNTLPYLNEERVSITKIEGNIVYGRIRGNTHHHESRVDVMTHQFVCDCDLANGKGSYTDTPQMCSHVISLILTK